MIFKISHGILDRNCLLISCLYSRFYTLPKFVLYFSSQMIYTRRKHFLTTYLGMSYFINLLSTLHFLWLTIIGDYDINGNSKWGPHMFCIDHVIVKRVTAGWKTSFPISPIFQLFVANGYAQCLNHLDALFMDAGPLFDIVVESVEWYYLKCNFA